MKLYWKDLRFRCYCCSGFKSLRWYS